MQSDLHRRDSKLGRAARQCRAALVAAVGLAGTPLFAQHEGHPMPGGSGEMPGMPGPNPIIAALPWLLGLALGAVAVWAILQSLRGKRPVWLNKQVVWGTVAMVVVYAGVSFAVAKFKRPGQMTVIEAQAMDMTVMKAPVGTAPVKTERVQRGPFDAKVTYTGSVVAYTDEDVYPRVTGWIRQMPVYPGDRVKAGQLVARLDAQELGSKVNEAAFARLSAEQMQAQMAAEEAQARAMQAQAASEQSYARSGVDGAEKEATGARSMVTEAQRNLAAAKAMARQTEKEVAGAQSALRGARSDLDGAREAKEQAGAAVSNAQAELSGMEADVAAAQANVASWRPRLKRSQALQDKGAISLEELQRDQADAQAAEAALSAAQAKVRQAKASISNAEAAVRQAEAGVRSAEAKVEQMQNEAEAAQAKLDQARANVDAMEAKVQQARAGADAAGTRVAQMRAMLDKSGSAVRSAIAGVDAAARKKQSAGAAAAQMQAALTTASVVKGYTEIRSSVDGVVTQRLVSPGVLVNPGTAILKIAQIDRVRLQANVAESDVASIRVGNPVRVHTMKDPGRVTETKVTSIFPAADPAARTVTVEALTPNADHHFVSGEYVVMEIGTQQARDVLTVASSAVVEVAPESTGTFYTEKQKAAWVVKARQNTGGKTEYYCTMHPEVVQDHPGNCPKCLMKLEPRTKSGSQYAHLVTVKTGASDGQRTEIVSGLNEGDEVIVAGNKNLHEGDGVSVGASEAQTQRDGSAVAAPSPEPSAAGHVDAMGASLTPGKAIYTCPMDPEVKSDKPGQCPKCGMRLEKQAASGAASGKGVYTCPMHPEVVSDKPGQCPKCNMALVKKG